MRSTISLLIAVCALSFSGCDETIITKPEKGLTKYPQRDAEITGNEITPAKEESEIEPPILGQDNTTPTKIEMKVGAKTYSKDGKAYEMDVAPEMNFDRVFIPIRYLEALGAKVTWQDRVATLTYGTITILFFPDGEKSSDGSLISGPEQAKVNGEYTPIDMENFNVKPYIKDKRLMAPVRFVAENLGYKVGWDQQTKVITITR